MGAGPGSEVTWLQPRRLSGSLIFYNHVWNGKGDSNKEAWSLLRVELNGLCGLRLSVDDV
jgi:hypothetical protein